MNAADKALTDPSWIAFALHVYEFSRLTKYVFADGSFLLVHWNGRKEANTITV